MSGAKLGHTFTILSMAIKYTEKLEDICDSLNKNYILILQSLKISQSFFRSGKVLDLIYLQCERMLFKKCLD